MRSGKTDNDSGAGTDRFDPANAMDETERQARIAIESVLMLIRLSLLDDDHRKRLPRRAGPVMALVFRVR